MGSSSPPHKQDRCVLVAVDFSAEGDAALAFAAEVADAMQVPLLMLHVVHDPAHAPGFYNVPDGLGEKARRKHEKRLEKRARTMHAAAEEMLRDYLEARREAHPDHGSLQDATVELVVGTPAKRIVEVAHERGARMIVMGTRGRNALAGILLGSNANRVVQLSGVPVTLVKAPERPERREEAS